MEFIKNEIYTNDDGRPFYADEVYETHTVLRSIPHEDRTVVFHDDATVMAGWGLASVGIIEVFAEKNDDHLWRAKKLLAEAERHEAVIDAARRVVEARKA